MSETESPVPDVEKPDEIVSLTEFCTHHSARERGVRKAFNSVEDLGAFEFEMKRQGIMKDTHESYMERLHTFMNSPA